MEAITRGTKTFEWDMATPDALDEVCQHGKLYTDLQKACQADSPKITSGRTIAVQLPADGTEIAPVRHQ
jgi:hypothetical protein